MSYLNLKQLLNMHTKNLFVSSLLIILSLFLNSCGACDGVAFDFTKVLEQQEPNGLNTSFANLIDKNTEILEDCSVSEYTKSKPSEQYWLKDYNLERYNVSYTCDILSFNIDIYKMENKFYTFQPRMAPCGIGQNVFFYETSENIRSDRWYKTKYELEYAIIGLNLQDTAFCNRLDVKINGSETHQCE